MDDDGSVLRVEQGAQPRGQIQRYKTVGRRAFSRERRRGTNSLGLCGISVIHAFSASAPYISLNELTQHADATVCVISGWDCKLMGLVQLRAPPSAVRHVPVVNLLIEY